MTMDRNKQSAAIIIPALDPDAKMAAYVEELIEAGFDRIILVNDGSDEEHSKVFDDLKSHQECVVLRHVINLGKGRGLKNAFNYFLGMDDVNKYCGVITVDSDGQHTVADVLKIATKMQNNSDEHRDSLVLGCRNFDLSHVPFKSRYGNKITIATFRLLHGVKLSDTQTGLRGIPTSLIPAYIDLAGERFEYETNMLIVSARSGIGITEVPIETVYMDNNAGTHFNPFRDSVAIYKLLFGTFFKYILSSLSSFVIDIALFQFVLMLTKGGSLGEAKAILVSTVVARVFSSMYNYLINRNIVFHSSSNSAASLIEYYILCVLQMACSAGLVVVFYNILGIPETVVKLIVDFVLFLFSYQIQKRFIFKR